MNRRRAPNGSILTFNMLARPVGQADIQKAGPVWSPSLILDRQLGQTSIEKSRTHLEPF